MNEYLQPGRFVDSAHPAVIDFARQHAQGAGERERAVALYYAVRDTIRYNPFQNFMADDAYRASACLERSLGWCVSKAAFNLSLCKRFRVKPLEFDGREDSIFHPFDEDDRRHMEYLRWRGEYADVPAEEIKRVFRETYPELFNLGPAAAQRQFV